MINNKYGRFAAALLFSCVVANAYSQSKDIPAELYKASTIPDSLKTDANSVVRYDAYEETVKGPGKASIKEHSIITILNDKAEREAAMILGYDKFNSVNSAEMIVYDENGKVIKKYHKGDMYDHSASDGVSIITDDRVMVAEHTIAKYPVTIEQITEQSMNSFLDLGRWKIQKDEQAVQNASYRIKINSAIGFRYLNKNTNIKPVVSNSEGLDIYQWDVKNLKAGKLEEEALDWQVFPHISFAANSFQYAGMPGDLTTWQSFGKWYQASLYADVCNLSPQRIEEIKQLTAGLQTDQEKTRFLYQYLQKNMRYVAVSLGIGGLKPFTAAFVDQKKYGDCKALANYMVAMLKAVNIKAYCAVIYGGSNAEPADVSFPSHPFNHVIACVPFKGDTTWLDCTDNEQPFGKLGTFTQNRNALLITEDGGKLVNTPKSIVDDNLFKSETQLILQPDGGAKVKVQLWGSGGYREMLFGIMNQKADDQKQSIIRGLGFKQPSILELKQGEDKDGIKQLDVNMEYDKFCDIMAGDKQFYRPRVFDLWHLTIPVLENRKSAYYFEHPMKKVSVTTIDLPPGFEVESMPANASLKFSFGTYDVTYVYNAAKNQIVNTTQFKLTNYVIPAAKYNEMQQYMDNIAKVQNKKLVIRKKA
jgi:hypothetical protein